MTKTLCKHFKELFYITLINFYYTLLHREQDYLNLESFSPLLYLTKIQLLNMKIVSMLAKPKVTCKITGFVVPVELFLFF